MIDAGDDLVVGLFHHTGVGKASGIPVEVHQEVVYEMEGGRVIRFRNYPDHAKTLKAAGLSE